MARVARGMRHAALYEWLLRREERLVAENAGRQWPYPTERLMRLRAGERVLVRKDTVNEC